MEKITKKLHYLSAKNKLIEISISLKNSEAEKIGIFNPNDTQISLSYCDGVIEIKKELLEIEEKKENMDNKLLILKKNQKIKIAPLNINGKIYPRYRLSIPKKIISTLGNPKYAILTFLPNETLIINFSNVEGDKMGKVVTIKINKGGTGKSFLTTQLASGLASVGKKVLVLTSDSQNNILDYTFKEEKKPLFDKGLKAFVKGEDGEIIQVRKNMFFIPLESPNFTKKFIDNFPKFIGEIKNKYDYIFIDSTPTEKLDKVFVSCSDEIIIPCQANRVSVQGALNTVTEVQEIKKEINKDIKVNAIVINMYENTSEQEKIKKELEEAIKDTTILFPTPIKKLAIIEKLLGKGKTVWQSEAKIILETQNTLIDMIKNLQ